jgi:nitrogen fixation NifU-like protein
MSDELYQQVILEHNKKPRNFRKIDPADLAAEGFNPLCGDHFWVYFKMDGDVIGEAAFEGSGCAISKASASMMTAALKGLTVEDAMALVSDFTCMIKGDAGDDARKQRLGKLNIFSGIWKFPSRVKCAVLAWHAAMGAFQHEQTVSTE